MSAIIDTEVRPEIRSLLGRLRGQIRSYVLVDALARVVALLGILFWLSLGVNWVYFKLSNLELPVWFRMGFMFVAVTGAVLCAIWLMSPLLRIMRAKALALVLERRFPELDDRLITAVEVAESRSGHDTELTAHMLKNTIDNVSRTVEQLRLGEVFDRRPRRRWVAVAVTLLIVTGALAAINFNAMKVWADAYINYKDVYWDRQTTIIIKVIAQPNDRVKDFLDAEGRPTLGQPGTYRHPRDEELALVIEVPHSARSIPVRELATRQRSLRKVKHFNPEVESDVDVELLKEIISAQTQLISDAEALPPESKLGRAQHVALEQARAAIEKLKSSGTPKDVEQASEMVNRAATALEKYAGQIDWKVPETIELDYELAGGRGDTNVTLRLKNKGDRTFLHSIGGLTDTIEALYVKGGDFANRRPYVIEVVDPPHIDRIVFESDYPDYTGRDAYDLEGRLLRDRRGLKGTQMALPLETEFDLHCFGNKPLVGARLQADINEQGVKDIEVQLRPYRDDAAGSARLVVSAIDGTRRTFDLPAETAWRFRNIGTENTLAERFSRLKNAVDEIRETRDAEGNAHRLTPATAADRLKRLRSLAKDSAEIETAYREIVERLDRNKLYPRRMVEGMENDILAPLAELNSQLFPAAIAAVEELSRVKEGDTGTLDRQTTARKGIDVMLVAMNNVANDMADGTKFDVPFHISTRALDRLASPEGEIETPLPFPPDREVRIYLEDVDDIIGTSPTRLTINGIIDQPPIVEAQLRGISTAITRRASIPVAGRILDDYGIAKARFEFFVDGAQPAAGEQPATPEAADGEAAEEAAAAVDGQPAAEQKWRVRPFRTRPEDYPLEFVLENSPDDRYAAARFEVLPLDLQIGQELTLTVYAEDGDDINGPHVTRGEKYRFRIVSNEELLSILYGRELGIRRRFEQIIEEVQETKKDLELHRDKLGEAETLRAAEDSPEKETRLNEINDAVGNAAGRGYHQVSKNHSETRDVAQSFRELLEELTNNGVHTDEQVRRIEALIVVPLDGINKNDYPAVLTSVNLFKQAHEKGADSRKQIGDSIESIDAMLLNMQKVLEEMEDLVEFHEALKDLEAIIGVQTDLEKAAREKQKKEAFDRLKKLGIE